jgi:hypothetical protein
MQNGGRAGEVGMAESDDRHRKPRRDARASGRTTAAKQLASNIMALAAFMVVFDDDDDTPPSSE